MSIRPPTPVPPVTPSWTRRQREVLDLLVRGRSNPEIAETLGVTLAGAKWHVSEILAKIDVQTREEAAEYWRAHNGLRPRFSRLIRGALPGSAWARWLAGGAAAGIGIAGAAGLVAAVISDGASTPADPGDATPTPPPTAVATPDASATPLPGTLLARTVACADPNEDGSCQIARQVEEYLRREEAGQIVSLGRPQRFKCPLEYSRLCEGASEGEERDGYRVSRHGSEGGPVSASQLREEIALLDGETTAVVGRGCLLADGSCEQFAISFVRASLPGVLYFTFERDASGRPFLVGMGVSGDNADNVLDGRPTRTQLGDGQTPTVFQPFPTSGDLIGELRSLHRAYSGALVTNVAPLDAALKAILAPEPEALARLLRPTTAACVPDDGRPSGYLQPPICLPGQAPGASVPAYLLGGCAESDGYGAAAAASDLAAYAFSEPLPRAVHAVISTSADPRVRYIVITTNGEKGLTLLLDDRGIVGVGGSGCGQAPFNEMVARAGGFAVPPLPARSLVATPRGIEVVLRSHVAAKGGDFWGSCDSVRGSEGTPSHGAWCFESVALLGQGRATAILRPVASATPTSVELQLVGESKWQVKRETARP